MATFSHKIFHINTIKVVDLGSLQKRYSGFMVEHRRIFVLENEIIKREDNIFKFNFVGVIIVDDFLINCYPKYIPNEDNIDHFQ